MKAEVRSLPFTATVFVGFPFSKNLEKVAKLLKENDLTYCYIYIGRDAVTENETILARDRK